MPGFKLSDVKKEHKRKKGKKKKVSDTRLKTYFLLKVEKRRERTPVRKTRIWLTKFIKERMSTCFQLSAKKGNGFKKKG